MVTPLRILIVEYSEDDALTIVRELRHGGRIWAESGKGSMFYFTIPVRRSER